MVYCDECRSVRSGFRPSEQVWWLGLLVCLLTAICPPTPLLLLFCRKADAHSVIPQRMPYPSYLNLWCWTVCSSFERVVDVLTYLYCLLWVYVLHFQIYFNKTWQKSVYFYRLTVATFVQKSAHVADISTAVTFLCLPCVACFYLFCFLSIYMTWYAYSVRIGNNLLYCWYWIMLLSCSCSAIHSVVLSVKNVARMRCTFEQ